ncbi:MAG: ferritin family protein [Deltaproteobacteria bacterium]|nr:ferritin family protein [Deltaproteobacteria bacterium]
MTAALKEILSGLQIAMEAEIFGHNFYKNTAQNTADPLGKETFTRMAEEELGHFHYLRTQYKSVMEKGNYDFSPPLSLAHQKHAGNPIFSNELRNRIKDSHLEISALSIGMKLELDAVNFYRRCARQAGSEEARKFYAELAEWEEDHYRAFEQQLDQLKDEYFQANNFFPF